MSIVKFIINEIGDNKNNSVINITIADNKVNVNAKDVEYKDMLKGLEALTFATAKVGINECTTPLEIFNVIQDITEVMVEGRDSAFEENN